jgi:ATP-dependent Clp protease protease subunit
MIHQPSGGTGRAQATDIQIIAKEIQRVKDELNNLMALHTGQPVERIQEDTERDNFMTSQQALDYGIIDEIIEPTPIDGESKED